MSQAQRVLFSAAAAASFAMLAGCGAGASSGTPAAADASAYADTLSYCGMTEPTGTGAAADGLSISSPNHFSSPSYDVNAVVSVNGSTDSSVPVRLQVDTHDYSTITGAFFQSGYADPASKMGVNFASVLPARGAGCVVSLAKLTSVPIAPVGLTGNTVLAWKSKWANSVPVAELPGRVVDGFEFVADFEPSGSTVFFFLLKSRIASTQGMSVCYRAPTATSWDCAAPSVTDAGTNWGLTRAGGKPGVYVVITPVVTSVVTPPAA